MPKIIKNAMRLGCKVYTLASPYGRKKLVIVTGLALGQGVFQVLGVTSIFPFLALAADPEGIRNSGIGSKFLGILPTMDDRQLLLVAGGLAILMLALANGVNLLAEFVRTRYAHGFGHWLRVRLLRKIASRSYGDFLQQNTAVLVKKVTGDVMQYVTGVLLPLLDSMARLITIALLVATLFIVDPKVALFAAAGLTVFYLIIFRIFGRWRRNTTTGLRSAHRGLFTEVQQMLGGIKAVKVHRAEEPFLERFSKHSERQGKLMAWIAVVGNGPRYLLEPIAFGGVVLIVMIYAARGEDFTSILPSLGVMALAGYRLLPALQLLYSQVNQLSTMSHALDEVYDEFLAVETSEARDAESPDGKLTAPERMSWSESIRFEEVSFCYSGADKAIIDQLSLEIPHRSSLGIIGPSGCGKSTLVDLLLGLHQPSSGKILVDGKFLDRNNRRAWRGGIGYVPQEIFLIDDTIAANIAFGIDPESINQAQLVKAAAAAQILDFIENQTTEGWETIVGERGVRLSGGQRQRIGLARALYHEPELLVLDEATSALDSSTERGVMNAIQMLNGSITIVIVAHRLSTVEHVDRILELDVN